MEWSGSTGRSILAGRDREVGALEDHARAAAAGAGRIVLLEGPAGIGKSALLGRMRPIAAAEGARWLAARGSEREREYPFGVVRQLLEPLLAEGDAGLLDGAAALARTALGPADADPGAQPGFPVLHGLFWLVANLAERQPVVLCVDDVQWADAPSLRFIDHLALRLDGLRVLGVLAARAGDATLTVGPIARLLQLSDVYALPVLPLDAGAVGQITRQELGDAVPEDLAAACHEVTGGNAFLLREILGELRRSGAGAAADPAAIRELAPPSIVRSLRLRLESLPDHAVALARAVAVLGDGADLRDAAELSHLRPEVAQDAADALIAADVLAPERPLRFAHAVVLAAARESMGAAIRSDLHRRAAIMAVARTDGGGLDAAASHLLAVDPIGDPYSAVLLRQAAGLARRRGAADTASTYLRRALAEPPGAQELPHVLVDLAVAAGFAGEPDSLVFAERALEVATEPALRLAAVREAGVVHIGAGRHELAADLMAETLDAGGLEPAERMAGEGLLLVAATIASGPRRTHGARVRRARDLAEQLGDAAPAALLVLASFELVLVEGDVRRGMALLDRALAGGRLLREVTSDSPFPYIAGNALIVGGRYGMAESLVNEVIADAASRGSIRAYALGTAQRGLLRFRHGRLAAAEADARAAIDMSDGSSIVQLSVAVAALAGALTDAGDPTGAAEALRSAPEAGRSPETHIGPVVEDMRARLLADEGRWEEAIVATEACAAWERHFGVQRGGWMAWRSLAAQGHAALGDQERATALAKEGVALARAFGVPRTVGIALRCAAAAEPDPALRAPLLQDAVTVLEPARVQGELVRLRADLAAALAESGDRDGARAAYDATLAGAEAIGAHAIEQRARDGLVKLGSRPRRRTTSGARSLTAGERRVAELAAKGIPNREIAEQLFLTLKTVENHLTATYRKLGIGSRAQLADRLG